MKQTKIHTMLSLLLGGFFLLLDQLFKYLAYTHPETSIYIFKPWLGWEYFENTGIAFGLPLPQAIIRIVTPLILVALLFVLYKNKQKSFYYTLGVWLIVFGAISNFIDRVLFSITIDYIRIITSVINIADIMIVVGALSVLLHIQKNKTARKS